MYLEHDELDEVVTQERTWALFAHDIIRMGQLIDAYQRKEKKYA